MRHLGSFVIGRGVTAGEKVTGTQNWFAGQVGCSKISNLQGHCKSGGTFRLRYMWGGGHDKRK